LGVSGSWKTIEERLERAFQRARDLQHENAVLLEKLKRLNEERQDLAEELETIRSSPGWRTIEKYRLWRRRNVVRFRWLHTRYERAASKLFHWTGALRPLDGGSGSTPAMGTPTPDGGADFGDPRHISQFVLFISGCPGGAYRYRAEYQAEELRLSGLTAGLAFADKVNYDKVLDEYAIFILHRVRHTPELEVFIHKARALGKPVIFDTDDLVFNERLADELKCIRDQTRDDFELHVSDLRRHYRTLSLCSAALVATEPLRDAIRELFPEMQVEVNRNAVSDEMVKQADLALRLPRPNDGRIRIAYFSGTRTHDEDFAECVPALKRLLKRHSQVGLMIVGHLDTPQELERFKGQIEHFSPVAWQQLPRLMRNADINLAPLETDKRFTHCKSELKYFEAGLLGLTTAASDLPAYRVAIRNGENGFICRTRDEWFTVLDRLVTDAELRTRVGENAREDVLRRYTTRARAPELAGSLKRIASGHAQFKTRSLSVGFLLAAPVIRSDSGCETVFALAHHLARAGHNVRLYIDPIAQFAGKTDSQIVEFCLERFGESPAEIHVGHEGIRSADIAIATDWQSAYIVDLLTDTRCKVYLILSYEPGLYDSGDLNYKRAEDSYNLPLKKITIGEDLAEFFSERDRMPVSDLPFFVERPFYRNREETGDEFEKVLRATVLQCEGRAEPERQIVNISVPS
jgi:glycosyltransferase involved in cell wall biosynthesis